MTERSAGYLYPSLNMFWFTLSWPNWFIWVFPWHLMKNLNRLLGQAYILYFMDLSTQQPFGKSQWTYFSYKPRWTSCFCFYWFIYFGLHWVLCCCRGLSLSLVVGHKLLIAATSLWWRTDSRAHGLQKLGLVGPAALPYMESSQTRHQNHVPCTGRRILYHWTAREVLDECF